MDYKPLEDYGVVGNLDTVALVGCDGSVDWCCLPHLESASVFAALLDAQVGGSFSIRPACDYEAEQSYRERTNVLETTFETASGSLTVTDFMPVIPPGSTDRTPFDALYRRVHCTQGRVPLAVSFRPRFDYARAVPEVQTIPEGVEATTGGESLSLTTGVPVGVAGAEATATPALDGGDRRWFVATYGHRKPLDTRRFEELLDGTVAFWRDWSHDCDEADCPVAGTGHDLATRASLVLKLLVHRETGAIAAAPTTSLPEEIGGVRNWDYRFNWIRDAAFTVQALYSLGHVSEARAFFRWMLSHCAENPAEIQPIYGLHGERDIPEYELDHLAGYRFSRPVRVGNAAATQRQLDVYGELVLGIYETALHGEYIRPDEWATMRSIVDYVCDVWREPDAGIWEVRSPPEQFLHSKVMCWAALDRGIAIAEESSFEGNIDRWAAERAAVREAIEGRGYDDERGSFVRSFGSPHLDSTSLLLPVVGFLPADDDRVQNTIETIRDDLTTDEGLVYRYEGHDGLPGGEGAFLLSSFWLVDALALSGRLDEARDLFDRLREYCSPLGLLSEEVQPETGELLGNFPQAYSHLGLINSAVYINRMAGERVTVPEPIGAEAAAPDAAAGGGPAWPDR
jgi:GH15 family glucan-1,4-alpha-glucosidase